jgi:hypothetical protein
MPSANLTLSTPVYKDNKILYPSNELFSKSSALLIDDVEYKLDFNFLNYINDTDCDEFIYEDGKCKIIRRVGVDADGNLYATGREVIETKKDIDLNIKYNSTIKLKSFDEAILETTYLLQNEYTDNFVTEVDAIARINLSPGEAKIQANKIKLEGYTTINNGFTIDLEGNATMNNATMNGGNILLTSNSASTPKFKVKGAKDSALENSEINIYPFMMGINDNGVLVASYGSVIGNGGAVNLRDVNKEYYTVLAYDNLEIRKNDSTKTTIKHDGIQTPILTQTSKAESKKDFELLKNALDILNSTDIYKYHLINENEDDKKHIGLVIGEKYKYSHEITSVNKDGEEIGVDTYSMISVLWKAVQEQQNQIEKLIKELNKGE